MMPIRSNYEAWELVVDNFGLVNKFVSEVAYKYRDITPSELKYGATLGLHKAALAWDPAQGTFGTFGFYWMSFLVRDEVRELRHGCFKRTGAKGNKLTRVIEITLDKPLETDEGEIQRDVADERADRAFEEADGRLELHVLLPALERLRPRERELLEAHYLRAIPMWQLAKDEGVTTARVSQLVTRAISKLRLELGVAA